MRFALILLGSFLLACSVAETKPPNVLIILVDDMGYGDLGIMGNETVQSPNIDALAREGVLFTQWIAGDSICTPSRGAMLTGRLPVRLGLSSGVYYKRVLQPLSPGGLPHSEHTLAEALKERGYKTHLTGKWHLGVGRNGEYLPTTHGFDHFYGMPLTNVQSCMPGKKIYKQDTLAGFVFENTYKVWTSLFLLFAALHYFKIISVKTFMYLSTTTVIIFALAVFIASKVSLLSQTMCLLNHDKEVIQQPIVLQNMAQRLVTNAKSFITESVKQEKPFFLYMSELKLHTALFSNPEFKIPGSEHHLEYEYLNNIRELDWSVGTIIDHLRSLKQFENTIIWLTSDNGPFLEEGVEGGTTKFLMPDSKTGIRSLKQLRGGKATIWEGGIRVPGMFIFKNKFAGNKTTNEAVSTIDIYPTTLNLVDSAFGTQKPSGLTYKRGSDVLGKIIDGQDIIPLVEKLHSKYAEAATTPHEYMIHYCGEVLSAVRIQSRFKAYFFTAVFSEPEAQTCARQSACQCQDNSVTAHDPPLLFDLDNDIEESFPLTPSNFTQYKQVMELVNKAVDKHKETLLKYPNNPNEMNKMQTPFVFPAVCCNFPFCDCDNDKTPELYI